jgi:hypothetical protein
MMGRLELEELHRFTPRRRERPGNLAMGSTCILWSEIQAGSAEGRAGLAKWNAA